METARIPGFTAEVALYKSRNRYRSCGAQIDNFFSADSTVPALNDADRGRCERCDNKCNEQSAECVGWATASWVAGLAGCAFFGPFAPACAIPVTIAYATATAGCTAKLATCLAAECHAPGGSCCPVFCGLGHCCSTGEVCTADGCCPRDRPICGGKCCEPGEHCCGGACCPPDMFCIDNVCQYPSFGPYTPAPVTETPPLSSTGLCPPDYFACHGKCCPNGMNCCGYGCEWGHCIN